MERKDRNLHEIEIEIIPMLKALLAKLWLLLLVGVIIGGASYVTAKVLVKPVYRSGFTAYINNQQANKSKESVSSVDLYAAQQLTNTYSYMLRSASILTASAEAIGSDDSYGAIKSKVSTEIQTDTEIIAVYVVDEDPQFAYDLARSISEVAPEYMADFVEGSSMKIIDYPVLNKSVFKPSYTRYGMIGFWVGFLLAVAFVLIRYFMDDTIKNEAEIEQRFPFPVLGVLPDATDTGSSSSDYYYYASDDYSSAATKKEQDQT